MERSFFGRSPAKKVKDLLSRIADDSGGRAYFPKDISEIPAIASQISKDLRTQYVVSYYPANDKRDGAFGAIQAPVNQVGGRKLIARTAWLLCAKRSGTGACRVAKEISRQLGL